jgi:hypothetical protein
MLHPVVWYKFTDDSEVLAVHPDVGSSKNLWNVGKLLPDYTAQHSKRQLSLTNISRWD